MIDYAKKHPLNFIAVVGFILTIVSVWFSIIQIWQAEPAVLNVTQTINKETGMISIRFENIAKHKESGIINFYQLETNDFKPFKQYPSLKPGKSRIEEFPITTVLKNLTITRSSTNPQVSIQINKFYLALGTSLSYRISCDNCYSQGIVKRWPDYEEMGKYERDFAFSLRRTEKGFEIINVSLPAYSWALISP